MLSDVKDTITVILLKSADVLKDNSDYFCAIDSKFGDGDHGITIVKIADKIQLCAKNWKEETFYEFMNHLGFEIMQVNGGSAGPLWGTLFQGFARAFKDEDTMTPQQLKKGFREALNEMRELTAADIGDKTMMDTLIPAVEASDEAKEDISLILKSVEQGAKAGMEATKSFTAKYGRAKSYGERTIGTPDAGAVSLYLFFTGLLEGYNNK